MMDYEPNLELPDGVSEMIEEPETDVSEPLSSITEESVEPSEVQEQGEQAKAKPEPGYVQGRISKAVEKVRAEYDQQIADLKADFEAQMAPLREQLIESQAQELVRTHKVSDIETAREFVRLKNGQKPAPQATAQPAQSPAKQQDPATAARIAMLDHQAERIKADTGIDVTELFMNDESIKQAVIAGDMDFYDVARQAQAKNAPKKRPPSPMRSPNGATGINPNAIATMTDEQFRRMVENVKKGARYKLE